MRHILTEADYLSKFEIGDIVTIGSQSALQGYNMITSNYKERRALEGATVKIGGRAIFQNLNPKYYPGGIGYGYCVTDLNGNYMENAEGRYIYFDENTLLPTDKTGLRAPKYKKGQLVHIKNVPAITSRPMQVFIDTDVKVKYCSDPSFDEPFYIMNNNDFIWFESWLEPSALDKPIRMKWQYDIGATVTVLPVVKFPGGIDLNKYVGHTYMVARYVAGSEGQGQEYYISRIYDRDPDPEGIPFHSSILQKAKISPELIVYRENIQKLAEAGCLTLKNVQDVCNGETIV